MTRENTIKGLRATIADSHTQIEVLRAQIKELSESLAAELTLQTQEQRQADFEVAQARGRKWKAEDPEGHEAFLKELRERNQRGVLFGAEQGWWDVDDGGNMLAPPIIIDSADLPDDALMAHVMAKAGIFPSVTRARKNGWDKPLTKGLVTVTKKKIRIKVV